MGSFHLDRDGAGSLPSVADPTDPPGEVELPRALSRRAYGIRVFGEPATRFEVVDRGKPATILVSDVSYFESDDDYTVIHASGRRHLVYIRLRDMLACLPPESFVQVHRGLAVNLEQVLSVGRFPGRRVAFTLHDGTVVVSSRRLAPGLRRFL